MSEVEEAGISPETLASLFKEWQGQMVGFARKRLDQAGLPLSVADPEDVVQEAFGAALENLAVIRTPRPYLYQVIRNEVRAQIRARAERHRLETARVADPTRFDMDENLEDVAQLVANRVAVLRYLQDLPEQQRKAVWLTKAVGNTQVEAAEVMGKSPNTVGVHAARAMAFLKSQLGSVVCALLGMFGTAGLADTLRRARPSSRVVPQPLDPGPADIPVWQPLLATLVCLAVLALMTALLSRSGTLTAFMTDVVDNADRKPPRVETDTRWPPRPASSRTPGAGAVVRAAEYFFDAAEK
ncbi:RNA polymerase sigma factor [Streptomyces xiangluensis]|uniref:RNA polymerase sigma factor n=1 Tax=Streptomyces xiangluensis TaxID=2665720 RepID=A0ABV8YUT1_9ACTN